LDRERVDEVEPVSAEAEEGRERSTVTMCEVLLLSDSAVECGGEAACGAPEGGRMLGGVGIGVIAPDESIGVVIETMRTRESVQPEARKGARKDRRRGERGVDDSQ